MLYGILGAGAARATIFPNIWPIFWASLAGQAVPALGAWPLLYHIGRDANEAYNVAKKYPEIVQAMEQRINAWRSDYYANPRGWQ